MSTGVVAPADAREAGAWSSFDAWVRLILRSTEGKLGVAILAIFLVVLVAGPSLAPYGPSAIGVAPPSSGPTMHHLLGGDSLGRDVLSRLLYGARSVIGVPLLATLLAFATGGLLGMIAGFVGGTVDTVIGRVMDILLSLPPLLIVLVVIAAIGSSTPILVASVAAVFAPRVARILRGATQGVAASEYVEAARARGERTLAIVLREILPNILPTVLVEFAVRLTFAIIFMATVNFLGLGFQPPSPNWGVMVSEQRAIISIAPLATLAPALAIGFVSIGVSLVADAATQALGLDRVSTTR